MQSPKSEGKQSACILLRITHIPVALLCLASDHLLASKYSAQKHALHVLPVYAAKQPANTRLNGATDIKYPMYQHLLQHKHHPPPLHISQREILRRRCQWSPQNVDFWKCVLCINLPHSRQGKIGCLCMTRTFQTCGRSTLRLWHLSTTFF